MTDLELVRAEIGDATPPSNEDIEAWLAEGLTPSQIAANVLNQRLMTFASTGTKFSLDGDLSIDNTASVKILDSAVSRLRSSGPTGSGRLVRADRER